MNGELRKTRGVFQLTDKILLAPNNPWLKSGTIRDNITFGTSLQSRPHVNKTRLYEKVNLCFHTNYVGILLINYNIKHLKKKLLFLGGNFLLKYQI